MTTMIISRRVRALLVLASVSVPVAVTPATDETFCPTPTEKALALAEHINAEHRSVQIPVETLPIRQADEMLHDTLMQRHISPYKAMVSAEGSVELKTNETDDCNR